MKFAIAILAAACVAAYLSGRIVGNAVIGLVDVTITNQFRVRDTASLLATNNDLRLPTAEDYIIQMGCDGVLTNAVNLMATNGTFCRVRGHKWIVDPTCLVCEKKLIP